MVPPAGEVSTVNPLAAHVGVVVREGEWFFRCETQLCQAVLRVKTEGNPAPMLVICDSCNQVFTLTKRDLKVMRKIHSRPDLTLEAKMDEFFLTRKTRSCPHCHKVIERSEGCPHMSCVCGNAFCWNCGGKYKSSHELLFGGHYSRWGINGCATLLLPDHKKACKAARVALFCGKMTALVTLGPPALLGGAILVGIPYGVYKGCRHLVKSK